MNSLRQHLQEPICLDELSPPNGSHRKNIPLAGGYIQHNSSRNNVETKTATQANHRLIALHWQGNSEHEQKIYSPRSFSFNELLSLKGIKNTEFIAIQKGEGLQQLQLDAGLQFVKGQETFNQTMDFRDTAAVIGNCDLVISSDSGVVHLAGAMGIPCWVALRWIPEWRGFAWRVNTLVRKRSLVSSGATRGLEKRVPLH